MNISLIIPSGGVGSRMKANIPKQYIEIDNIPIIIRTLLAFNEISEILNIIIPIDKSWEEFIISKSKEFGIKKNIIFVNSGSTRAESIKNALISEQISQSEFVLIHDAVRCLISQTLIKNIIYELKNHNAVIPAIKITDTIKEIKGNFVNITLDRNSIFKIQTPQAFKISDYLTIIDKVDINNTQFSDDASIFEYFGYRVFTVDGDNNNIKITTNSDLDFVKYIINKNIG